MSTSSETVVLKLNKVNFRHTEYTGLGDFLVKKYGFILIEEVNQGISEAREIAQIDRKNIVLEEEKSARARLVKKYGFNLIEDVNQGISETRETAQIDRKNIDLEEEKSDPIIIEVVGKKTSSRIVFEGYFMDAKIKIQVLGDIVQTESLIEISEEEKYKTYNLSYQMIKLSSTSGYSLQQFLEKLVGDLGLSIDSQIWSFHRVSSA